MKTDFQKLHEEVNHSMAIEMERKLQIIREWINQNVSRNKPEVTIYDIEAYTTVIDEKYVFFFEGRHEEVRLKAVLKRKNMKRRCSWLCNGQAGTNMKQMYFKTH